MNDKAFYVSLFGIAAIMSIANMFIHSCRAEEIEKSSIREVEETNVR